MRLVLCAALSKATWIFRRTGVTLTSCVPGDDLRLYCGCPAAHAFLIFVADPTGTPRAPAPGPPRAGLRRSWIKAGDFEGAADQADACWPCPLRYHGAACRAPARPARCQQRAVTLSEAVRRGSPARPVAAHGSPSSSQGLCLPVATTRVPSSTPGPLVTATRNWTHGGEHPGDGLRGRHGTARGRPGAVLNLPGPGNQGRCLCFRSVPADQGTHRPGHRAPVHQAEARPAAPPGRGPDQPDRRVMRRVHLRRHGPPVPGGPGRWRVRALTLTSATQTGGAVWTRRATMASHRADSYLLAAARLSAD